MDLDLFIDEHYDRVVRSVALVAGDIDVARDAVHLALVKAVERSRRGSAIDNLPAWIVVVATNSLRRRWRRSVVEERSIRLLAPLQADAGAPNEERVELLRAIGELPIRQRQSVVLFYVHDLSVDDVAAALGVSSGTVKTALSRARVSLAHNLAVSAGAGVDGDLQEEPHV